MAKDSVTSTSSNGQTSSQTNPNNLKGTRRKIVLDTNVILFDAMAFMKFHAADIHIPITVIEEGYKFKRDPGENGRNARQFSRFVDLRR